MKHQTLLLTLTLLLVAASPQLLVEISNEQGQATIINYERTQGTDPTRTTGPWTLELLDAQGIVVSQTQFHAEMILPDGTTTLLEEIHVPIQAPASAYSISLLDPDGDRVSAYEIAPVCGDGRCDPSERGVCPEDCAEQTTQHLQETQQANEQEAQRGLTTTSWLVISSVALLILVLILVLVHLNRKKENPVQIH